MKYPATRAQQRTAPRVSEQRLLTEDGSWRGVLKGLPDFPNITPRVWQPVLREHWRQEKSLPCKSKEYGIVHDFCKNAKRRQAEKVARRARR